MVSGPKWQFISIAFGIRRLIITPPGGRVGVELELEPLTEVVGADSEVALEVVDDLSLLPSPIPALDPFLNLTIIDRSEGCTPS